MSDEDAAPPSEEVRQPTVFDDREYQRHLAVVTSEESGDLKRLERDYQPTRVTENWTALNAAGVSQQARSSSPSPRPSGDPPPEGGS